MVKIAVIGAGLSGLTFSRLASSQCKISLFEKSRGVGGRLATRRAPPFSFDHGAQYFTVKNNAFMEFLKPMIDEGVIQTWRPKFVEIHGNKVIRETNWSDEYSHYVGTPSMNAIAKFLVKDIDINLESTITHLERKRDLWQIYSDDNMLGEFDWLICTAPAEQTYNITHKYVPSNFNFPTMQPCYSMMLGFAHDIELGFDAAFVLNKDISWISKNNSKPHRSNDVCFLVNSTNKWANDNIDIDKTQALNYLFEEFKDTINVKLPKPTHMAIHLWRYANIEKQKSPTHYIDRDLKLGLCGDWFIHGRVESAFTSAYDLFNNLQEI